MPESTPPPPPTRSGRSAAKESLFRLASPARKRNCCLPLASTTKPQPVRETRNGRDGRRKILTPFGLVDISFTESLHVVLRRYRMKGLKWGAAQCWLGETYGFLRWQRLQLALWGRNK
jgi:hypothetical protein